MTQTFLSEFVDGGPGCMRDDCQVQTVSGNVTLTYYPPTMDTLGNNINPDKNITTNNQKCNACGKSWTERWQGGYRID